MIRAIIFDCFGVLTTDLWKEFVAKLPEWQKEPARELNRAYDAGHIDRHEFLAGINELTDHVPQEVEVLQTGEAVKNEELLVYIEQLHNQYKTAILSNIASGWIEEQFLTDEEQQYFEDFIYSRDVGMVKPNPRIFELAAERLGVSAKECVLVDDVDRNVAAAQALGMKGIVYQDFAQFKGELEAILADSKN
jgi:putative hydrolase of the HAD superfamily